MVSRQQVNSGGSSGFKEENQAFGISEKQAYMVILAPSQHPHKLRPRRLSSEKHNVSCLNLFLELLHWYPFVAPKVLHSCNFCQMWFVALAEDDVVSQADAPQSEFLCIAGSKVEDPLASNRLYDELFWRTLTFDIDFYRDEVKVDYSSGLLVFDIVVVL